MKQTIESWLRMLAQSEAIPSDIKAVYFGIFDLAPKGYGLYLIGSRKYDPDDNDWACFDDYQPANKYLLFAKGTPAELDWESFGKSVESSLNEILKADNPDIERFLGKRIITWGFDSGDLTRLR